MNTNMLLARRWLAPVIIAAQLLVESASAQIVYGDFTNSVVSFLKVTESGPNVPPALFAPPAPTLSQAIQPTLTFAPNNFVQTDQSLAFDLKTKTSQLQMDIQATPGLWFGHLGKVLELHTSGSYSLVAPFGPTPQSQAFASFSASFTLMVNEVDNNPFSSGAPFSANINIVPSGASIIGPGGSTGGAWNGSAILDINTVKSHFGIAPTSNVTGVLLQYTANLSAAAVYGQATASLLSVNLVPGIVPEPSTCALLLLTGAGALWWARRRQ